MAMFSKPIFVRDFDKKKIYCVEFSPYEWSQQLIAVGTSSKVIIAKIIINNDVSVDENVQFEILKEFHHSSPVTALAWSSLSNVAAIPRICKVASVGIDKRIRIYTSDLDKGEEIQEFTGHLDFVNALTFASIPDDGKELLFSVSDDCTCKIWSASDGSLLKSISLSAPGVAVKLNPSDPSKILLFEKTGLVRIYSCPAFLPVTSVDPTSCGFTPCLDADWSLTNPQQFVILLGNRFVTWNLSQLSSPVQSDIIFSQVAQKVKLHPTLQHYSATQGLPGPVVQVYHAGGQVVTSEPLLVSNDISWHLRAPILAVANDDKLKLWKILVK